MPNGNFFKQCIRCVMNNEADRSIIFDDHGLCHHCIRYDALIVSRTVSKCDSKDVLKGIVNRIKRAGRDKKYDCIVGVSGGVDSTYVAYLSKQLGLNPLAIHFDNGWNSELAVKNIEMVLKKLDIDLVTYVIDWEEFKDLQLSFLKASVPDGEIPTDHAIFALLWQMAAKYNIRYILSGMNFATESISVPGWSYGHSDWRYIKDVHKKFGSVPLKHYPHYGFLKLFYFNFVKRIRSVSILNYIDYRKDKVMDVLQNELGWIYYGGKHYESIYTRFFQGYILPVKFGIDKRFGHYSDLINAGQMTREEALRALDKPTYSDALKAEDLAYAAKKFSLSKEEFQNIIAAKPRDFRMFKNSYAFVARLKIFVNLLRKWGFYPK